MSKLLVLILATVVYLTPLYPVYAQPVNTPSRLNPSRPATGSALQRMEQTGANAMMRMESNVATRAAELKAKLQRFKDKNKAARIENINGQLASLNQKATARMQTNLTSISALVTKIKSWVADQEATGQDMTAAKSSLMDIESAWSEASSSVSAQAGNDYTIAVNTESTVKADAQAARDDLKNDLKAVHDQLVSLRQDLASILTTWKGQSDGQ